MKCEFGITDGVPTFLMNIGVSASTKSFSVPTVSTLDFSLISWATLIPGITLYYGNSNNLFLNWRLGLLG